jgi:hypothetical protein
MLQQSLISCGFYRFSSEEVPQSQPQPPAQTPEEEFDAEWGNELNFMLSQFHVSQPQDSPFMPYIH